MNILSAGDIKIPNLYSLEIVSLANEHHEKQKNWPESYLSHTMNNPLCGDEVKWYLSIQENSLSFLFHQTIGCLLCQAASNLCLKLYFGQKKSWVLQSISEKSPLSKPPKSLGDWHVFEPVLSSKTRMQCATIPLLCLKKVIEMA